MIPTSSPRPRISAPDEGVRGLRPDLYDADLAWLTRTAEDEARALLAETEPVDDQTDYTAPRYFGHLPNANWPCGYCDVCLALAEALARFIAEPIQ